MSNYIDGFILPIPRARLDRYRRVVEAVAAIWKEHGALDYREYVGDDVVVEGTRSFVETAGAADDEVVIFGWVTFESKDARDQANERVAADPRMAELIDPAELGFDARRMAYGGFQTLVSAQTPANRRS